MRLAIYPTPTASRLSLKAILCARLALAKRAIMRKNFAAGVTTLGITAIRGVGTPRCLRLVPERLTQKYRDADSRRRNRERSNLSVVFSGLRQTASLTHCVPERMARAARLQVHAQFIMSIRVASRSARWPVFTDSQIGFDFTPRNGTARGRLEILFRRLSHERSPMKL